MYKARAVSYSLCLNHALDRQWSSDGRERDCRERQRNEAVTSSIFCVEGPNRI
jgi:hypothetical protein